MTNTDDTDDEKPSAGVYSLIDGRQLVDAAAIREDQTAQATVRQFLDDCTEMVAGYPHRVQRLFWQGLLAELDKANDTSKHIPEI